MNAPCWVFLALCRHTRVSLRTGVFNPTYANGTLCQLPYPIDDSRLIIQAVQNRLKQLYREGFSYATPKYCCWISVEK